MAAAPGAACRLAGRTVPGRDQAGYDGGRRRPGGSRAARGPLAQHGAESGDDAFVAGRIEARQQRPAGILALAAEKRGQVGQSGAVVIGEVLDPSLHALELDVEVAHRSEDFGQPAQLVAHVARPDGQGVLEEGQGGPGPSGGHPHVVQFLGVLAQARARLVGEHGVEAAPEDGEGHVAHRRVGLERHGAEVGGRRDAQPGGE